MLRRSSAPLRGYRSTTGSSPPPETIPPDTVATIDAVHLATAVKLGGAGVIESVMAYGARFGAGAEHHGLGVLVRVRVNSLLEVTRVFEIVFRSHP